MVKNKRVALVFRAASLLFAVIGFLSMMGVFRGDVRPGILSYYTMQSNMLAIILFTILTVRTALSLREGRIGASGHFARFEMVCVINVMLTFVVYWVLLAPDLFTMVDGYSLRSFDNLAVHGVTPLLCLLDYILFTQARHLKYRDVYYVCIYPLIYVAGTSLAGLLGYVYSTSPVDGGAVRFPYFFYDFDRIGIASLAYIGGLILFFLLISHCFYLVDNKVRKSYELHTLLKGRV
jgi:hypothetical protein